MGRFFRFIAILSFLTACGGESTPSESELLAQNKSEGAVLSQRNSLEAATITTATVLNALGLAKPADVQSAINAKAMKNAAIPGLLCTQGMAATLSPQFGGSVSVAGDCVETVGEDCSYAFTGTVAFSSLLIGPGAFLNGSLNVFMTLNFPDCNPDLDQAAIIVELSGLATVGDHEILGINAAMSALADALTGDVTTQVGAMNAVGRFRTLNCFSTLTTSSCFVDTDNDLVDDDFDNCGQFTNANQSDTDTDGVGDVCDNCPITANSDQADGDGDGQGDACLHICAPGVAACNSAEDCPIELGCSEAGCCEDCPFVSVSLSCRQAEAINEAHGLSGSCETFNHTCEASTGCCDFLPAPEPLVDLCDDSQDIDGDTFPDVGVCAGGLGFCADFTYATICLVFPDPDAGCPKIAPGADFAQYCGDFGQLSCNVLISNDQVSKDYSCNGVCCVEP